MTVDELPPPAAEPSPEPVMVEPDNADHSVTSTGAAATSLVSQLEQRVQELQQQEQALKREIGELQATYARIAQTQWVTLQEKMEQFIQESLSELEQRKQSLQMSIEQLERRQDRIRNEMKTTFAGSSQDLAIRVQGFKDYLVGSLQDLVTAAEQLKLAPPKAEPRQEPTPTEAKAKTPPSPRFAEQAFQEEVKHIRNLLDRYRTKPDYYGPPWQLRRTFEPVHAERVANWFFTQGGRGALKSMGSRLQNILIAAAVISVLRDLYDDRVRVLILANTPEHLGEWRRGLQDCLGISRGDFGPDQGMALFDAPEVLMQKAERMVKRGDLPLVIIDESEDQISLGLLQFPLWLAFATNPQIARGFY